MGVERLNYRDDAMLIEASRILSPQFDQMIISLTGAQVELLRNATMVFHKESTFVSTYHDGYYYTATTADFDAISTIVANLEEKLMGNENTIFGYKERYLEEWINESHAAGLQLLETLPVPAGYVHVVEHIYSIQHVTSNSFQQIIATNDTNLVIIGALFPVVAGVPMTLRTHIVLKEEDYIRCTWGSSAVDEHLGFGVWGYKMKVPGG